MDQVKQRTMLELVKVAKEKGDADAILEIVRYMQPLINKYAKNSYLAEYEDMQQELCLALLESIHKIKKIGNYSEPALLKDEIRVTCDRIFDCFVSIVSLFMCRAYVGHDF